MRKRKMMPVNAETLSLCYPRVYGCFPPHAEKISGGHSIGARDIQVELAKCAPVGGEHGMTVKAVFNVAKRAPYSNLPFTVLHLDPLSHFSLSMAELCGEECRWPKRTKQKNR